MDRRKFSIAMFLGLFTLPFTWKSLFGKNKRGFTSPHETVFRTDMKTKGGRWVMAWWSVGSRGNI